MDVNDVAHTYVWGDLRSISGARLFYLKGVQYCSKDQNFYWVIIHRVEHCGYYVTTSRGGAVHIGKLTTKKVSMNNNIYLCREQRSRTFY